MGDVSVCSEPRRVVRLFIPTEDVGCVGRVGRSTYLVIKRRSQRSARRRRRQLVTKASVIPVGWSVRSWRACLAINRRSQDRQGGARFSLHHDRLRLNIVFPRRRASAHSHCRQGGIVFSSVNSYPKSSAILLRVVGKELACVPHHQASVPQIGKEAFAQLVPKSSAIPMRVVGKEARTAPHAHLGPPAVELCVPQAASVGTPPVSARRPVKRSAS